MLYFFKGVDLMDKKENMQNNNFKLNLKRTWKYIKEAKMNLFGYEMPSLQIGQRTSISLLT